MIRFVKYTAALAVLGYLVFLGILYANQDRVVFMTQPDPVDAPAWENLSVETITTTDNESLVSWYLPASADCPTLLMFHGNAERLWPRDPELQFLRDQGLGFLNVAFRGYSGSTGKPSEQGVYNDARAAYMHLRAIGVPATDIVVRGFSLGGAPSTLLATEQEIGALILGAPFYSAVQMGKDRLPLAPVGLLLKHDFRTDLRIADVTAPVLIGHGEADQIVPAWHSERLQALVPDNVHRVTFPGVDHNSLFYSGMYRDAIWPFLGPLYPACDALQSTDEVTL